MKLLRFAGMLPVCFNRRRGDLRDHLGFDRGLDQLARQEFDHWNTVRKIVYGAGLPHRAGNCSEPVSPSGNVIESERAEGVGLGDSNCIRIGLIPLAWWKQGNGYTRFRHPINTLKYSGNSPDCLCHHALANGTRCRFFGGFSLALHSFVISPAHHSGARRWRVSVQEIFRDGLEKVSFHRPTICGFGRLHFRHFLSSQRQPECVFFLLRRLQNNTPPDTCSRRSPMNFHHKTND